MGNYDIQQTKAKRQTSCWDLPARVASLCLAVAAVGCAKVPAAPAVLDGAQTSAAVGSSAMPALVEAPGEPAVHRFTHNWGTGLGCVPKGGELTLRGTVRVRPFGKGSDGAVIDVGTEEWVVSYRAEGVLLELRDVAVTARGRACDKQGEAIAGKHFDLHTLERDTP